MPFKIEEVQHLGIIKIIYSGVVTLDERVNVVHALCVDYYDSSRLKICIDGRLIEHAISAAEQEVFGAYVASREELKDALVALIVNDGQIMNSGIFEKSSKLGHHIAVFDNENDALRWLVS